MRILNISTVDYAGCGINLTNAINRYSRHESRNLNLGIHRFGYETDIVTNDKAEIKKWLNWADVVSGWVTFDVAKGMLPKDKILVLHHIGGHYYGAPEIRHQEAEKKGAYQFVSGAYMTRWGLPWLPFVVPVGRYEKYVSRKGGTLIVAQTASNPKRRQSEKIKKMLGNRRIEIITGVSHKECLKKRGKASIAIGCYKGYGTGDAEAWSMYQPVISYPMSPDDERAEVEQIGYLPYYRAEVEELPDVLDRFLSSPSLRKEWGGLGYKFVREFHDAPVVARKFTRFLEGL